VLLLVKIGMIRRVVLSHKLWKLSVWYTVSCLWHYKDKLCFWRPTPVLPVCATVKSENCSPSVYKHIKAYSTQHTITAQLPRKTTNSFQTRRKPESHNWAWDLINLRSEGLKWTTYEGEPCWINRIDGFVGLGIIPKYNEWLTRSAIHAQYLKVLEMPPSVYRYDLWCMACATRQVGGQIYGGSHALCR